MILPHGEEVIARWTIRGSAAALPTPPGWDTSGIFHRLPVVARLSHRRRYQDGRMGTLLRDSENSNGGYSCEDHRLTGLGIKTLSVVLCEGRRQENQQLRS
jgi:hypothetical protein